MSRPPEAPSVAKSAETWQRGSWFYPALLAAAILAASARSEVAAPGFLGADKIAHFLVYGLLATLVARTQRRSRGWWGAVAASLFGLVDETWQGYTPGRVVEVADWMADAAGAVLAVTLYLYWPGYRRLLEFPLGRRRSERRVAMSASPRRDSVP